MDTATGLIYVGNGQYYDPSTGRFLTRQVNPNSANPYVPWNFDPAGFLFAPLALLVLVYGKKRKRGKLDTFLIVLVLGCAVGMSLTACDTPTPTPGTPPTSEQTETPVPPKPSETPGPGQGGSGSPTPAGGPSRTPSPCADTLTPTPSPTPIQNLDQYFASLQEPYAQLPSKMKISQAGIEFLKKWEGYVGQLYNDGNNPTDRFYYDTKGNGTGFCTVGYGHRVHSRPCDGSPQEKPFENGISEQNATALMLDDAYIVAEVWIQKYITVKLTQTQYDALVSLYFNWGGDRILIYPEKAQLLNNGQYVATANHIRTGPVTSNGVFFESLQRRRNEEADMFLLLPVGSLPNQ